MVNAYQVELWDVSGQLRQTVVRETDWFKPWKDMYPQNGPPNPFLSAVRQDTEGLLWTIVGRLDANAAAARAPQTGCQRRADCANQEYDTMIEVLDPRSGALLASRRFPEFLRGFWSDDLLTSASVGPDDTPYIDIWQVRLVRH
jgi:hypothetical protein